MFERIQKMLSAFAPAREEEEQPVMEQYGVDEDGNTLFKDTLIAQLNKRLEDAKQDRKPFELQWQLNANFLAGNQFVDINTYTGTVEEQERPFEFMAHEVHNQVAPLIETRIANLEKINYDMVVRPRTNELSDFQKAQISTKLLEYQQMNSNFAEKMHSAITWAETYGTVFILSWWDSMLGEVIGKATLNVEHDDIIESQTVDVHEGDLDYGLISSFEIYPESVYKESVDEQRYVFIEQALTTAEVYDRYGKKLNGGEVSTYTISPRPNAGGFGYEATVMSLGTKSVPDAVLVRTYFEKPSRVYPKGRLCIYTDDEVLFYGNMPTEFYPIAVIKSKIVPGQFFGKSVIQDLIPLQREYNAVCNSIADYIQTLAIGGYIAEEGAIDVDEFAEYGAAPGSILTYKAGRNPPVPKQNSALPQTVLERHAALRGEMEYVAAVSQLMVSGNAPTGITSGVAMQNLQNIDNTRLALTGNNIRDAVIKLAKMWLSIFRSNVTGYRACRINGSNSVGDVIVWCCEDINSWDVEFSAENELIHSPEAKREEFLQLLNLGMLTDETGVVPQRTKQKINEAFSINDFAEIATIDELQTQLARRENSFMREGIIPNIHEYDDDDIHADEHLRFILQTEFSLIEKNEPQKAEAFIAHMNEHKRRIEEKKQQAAMMSMGGMQ